MYKYTSELRADELGTFVNKIRFIWPKIAKEKFLKTNFKAAPEIQEHCMSLKLMFMT
jgi:hypothetical protein